MKMPSEGEAKANNSDPNLSALAGSSWDACSESLAVDGLEAIPYEQLQESCILRDVADRLNYRNATAADFEKVLGYPIPGCWIVAYANHYQSLKEYPSNL